VAPFLALVGFMGSGKSSVGSRVAILLGWTFVDLDEVFVEAEGIAISDYFASRGEQAFRQRETELLQKVLDQRDSAQGLVLALGGGTLESPCAAEVLARLSGVVYLDVDAERAWQRAGGTARPLAVDEERFRALLARRHERYEMAANWVLPVEDRSVEDLARQVVELASLSADGSHVLWGRRLKATQRSSLVIGGVGALSVLEGRAASVHQAGHRLFVITDRNVANAWGRRVVSLMEDSPEDRLLVVDAGENSKNADTLAKCWEWLAASRARRDDVVVALGGGVVGDLAGFAAATYQRGISLWQVPTTLLAQVDSSIGGKTAIDLAAGKNLVGAFYQPDLVVADPVTLTSLREQDYIGGLGEVVKHTLLMTPASLDRLEAAAGMVIARDLPTVAALVRESVGFKARVVQEDEREHGMRATLNLGHTVGHAIEVVQGYGCMSHGSAVSLGLLVALALSEQVLGLDPAVRKRTERLLSTFGLPTRMTLPSIDLLLAAARLDKKVRAGSSGFVGLRALGEPVWGLDVSQEQLARTLEVIRK
jgi:shikimate kinase/3-dehydroquinate synthase